MNQSQSECKQTHKKWQEVDIEIEEDIEQIGLKKKFFSIGESPNRQNRCNSFAPDTMSHTHTKRYSLVQLWVDALPSCASQQAKETHSTIFWGSFQPPLKSYLKASDLQHIQRKNRVQQHSLLIMDFFGIKRLQSHALCVFFQRFQRIKTHQQKKNFFFLTPTKSWTVYF